MCWTCMTQRILKQMCKFCGEHVLCWCYPDIDHACRHATLHPLEKWKPGQPAKPSGPVFRVTLVFCTPNPRDGITVAWEVGCSFRVCVHPKNGLPCENKWQYVVKTSEACFTARQDSTTPTELGSRGDWEAAWWTIQSEQTQELTLSQVTALSLCNFIFWGLSLHTCAFGQWGSVLISFWDEDMRMHI